MNGGRPDRQSLRLLRRFSFGRSDLERELDDELAFHLEAATRELIAAGSDPQSAREEAERRFGNLDRHRRDCRRIDRRFLRQQRRGEIMSHILLDLRCALRSFAKSPAFVAAAVLTLALGIGANTAIFSVVHGVLLAPLPLPEADRLVAVSETRPQEGLDALPAAAASLLAWRQDSAAIDDLTAHTVWIEDAVVEGTGETAVVAASAVYWNFFEVLGVQPVLGRGFTAEGVGETAVISHRLWQRRFGGDPAVLGRTTTVDGVVRTIVGVMPDGFSYPLTRQLDIWYPFRWSPELAASPRFRQARWLRVIGRLAPGATRAQAQAELAVLADGFADAYPDTHEGYSAEVTSLHSWVTGDARQPLLLLWGAVALVLLIACANLANLHLSRALARGGELRVRVALGAGRGRLLQQLFTEGLVLSLAGGALGVLLGLQGVRLLATIMPQGLPRLESVAVDAPVLMLTLAITLLTSLLFTLTPGLVGRGAAGGRLIPERDSISSNGAHQLLRRLLVAGEVALACLLLVGAGLLLHSLLEVRRVDPGFEAEGVVTAKLSLPSSAYSDWPAVTAAFQRLERESEALPGVTDAVVASHPPMSGQWGHTGLLVPEREGEELSAHRRLVGPGYFEALGIELLAGRTIDRGDDASGTPVAVINRSLADRLFPPQPDRAGTSGAGAIGRRLATTMGGSDEPVWRTIVGVVADEKLDGLETSALPEVLIPVAQEPFQAESTIAWLLVKSGRSEAAAVAGVLPRVIGEAEPGLAVLELSTLEETVARSLVDERFLLILLGSFALLALVLAAVGIYGVVSFSVARQRREIGIRLALGAAPGLVAGRLLRQVGGLVLAGLAVGLIASWLAAEAVAGLLYQVAPLDPASYLAAAGALLLVGLLASLPALHRAVSVDPAVTLRQE